MTSRRPYWCTKLILRELNYFVRNQSVKTAQWHRHSKCTFRKEKCFEVKYQLHKIAPTSCSRFHIKMVCSIIFVRILFLILINLRREWASESSWVVLLKFCFVAGCRYLHNNHCFAFSKVCFMAALIPWILQENKNGFKDEFAKINVQETS